MHILIVGKRAVGKSTLIRRVLRQINVPVYGFETVKEDGGAKSPLYIYPYGQAHAQSIENLVAYCDKEKPMPFPDAFDRFAKAMPLPQRGGIIVMDELGFLESDAPVFQQTVLQCLHGDIPVIAAVKDIPTPFLNAVRFHPKCRSFCIDAENRDALLDEVLSLLRSQL